MTHSELVDRAVVWLRTRRRCVVVAREFASMAIDEPDAIGWTSGGLSVLIECKTSLGDFTADARKMQRQQCIRLDFPGRQRYYMVPADLKLDPGVIPEEWGLLRVTERRVDVVRQAPILSLSQAGSTRECALLVSALRRNGEAGKRWGLWVDKYMR